MIRMGGVFCHRDVHVVHILLKFEVDLYLLLWHRAKKACPI